MLTSTSTNSATAGSPVGETIVPTAIPRKENGIDTICASTANDMLMMIQMPNVDQNRPRTSLQERPIAANTGSVPAR